MLTNGKETSSPIGLWADLATSPPVEFDRCPFEGTLPSAASIIFNSLASTF